MKVLLLGSIESPLIKWLESVGEEVVVTMDPVDTAFLDAIPPDFIVSYGYRHIIKRAVLMRVPGRFVNLHISYLPWNRGADPNFWSCVEDTPRGVTIHYVDEGVDTGDIIAQREVVFSEKETLRTAYGKLQGEVQALFRENWASIRAGRCNRKRQEGKGTFHRLKDKETLEHLLISGWETPIARLEEFAAETQMTMQLWEEHDAEIEEMRRQDRL